MSTEDQSTETPMDFNTFIMSLSTSALLHMGALPDAEGIEKNLPMAKHTIDCLAMLEDKTKGNLSGEEERLLNEVLYDLRMRFVSASKDDADA